MEHPIQRLIKEKAKSPITEKTGTLGRPKSFGLLDATASAARDKDFKHENFGRDILLKRPDIANAIEDFNSDNEIGNIFTKDHIDNFKYSQFVTGTLDADRLDFLLRDSLAAGVSYGNIDLKYLLDNFQYDKDTDQFYIDYSGIHALEHFITSRFFLYNVTYHKTVMGFELLAKHAFYRMAKDEQIDVIAAEGELQELLGDTDQFVRFDDQYFWLKLREWQPADALDVAVRRALLFRQPARELFSERDLVNSSPDQKASPSRVLNSQLYNNIAFDQLIERHRVDRSQLAVLTNEIEFEESAPMKARFEQPDIRQEWALCKVFYDDHITPLIDVPGSIVQTLSYMNLRIRRLYYLPLDENQKLKRDELRAEIRALAADT